MSQGSEFLPETEYKPGFKLYRGQESFEFPQDVYEEIGHSLPNYTLYNARHGRVKLLNRSHTDEIITRSRDLSSMPIEAIVKAVTLRGKAASTRQKLVLPPSRIDYRPTRSAGVNVMYVLLEDKNGVLMEERDRYLKVLAQLGGIRIPLPDFVPEIILGHITDEVPQSNDALDLLAPHIPDKIRLTHVRSTPNPAMLASAHKKAQS